jgi:hypothetical protein
VDPTNCFNRIVSTTTLYQPHCFNHTVSTTLFQPHCFNHTVSTTLFQPHCFNHTVSTTLFQPHCFNHIVSTTLFQPHCFNHIVSTTLFQPHCFNHTVSTTLFQPHCFNHTVSTTLFQPHCFNHIVSTTYQQIPPAQLRVVGIGSCFTACTPLPCLKDGLVPLHTVPAFKQHLHAWPKLWKYQATQSARRLTQSAQKHLERDTGKRNWLDQRYGGKVGAEWMHAKALDV